MKKRQTVHVSSKGEIVIPADVRRAMGLLTGCELRVRLESPRKLVLTMADYDEEQIKDIFRRAREWTEKSGRDLVEELHRGRRRAREKEVRRRAYGRY